MGAIETSLRPAAARASEETLAFLKGEHPLFIDGQATAALTGDSLDVVDPATGQVIATVASGGAADIDKAVKVARRALEKGPWATMTSAERAAILWRIADGLEARADLLSEVETLDNGMPLAASRGMVAGAAGILRYYAGWCGKITGEVFPIDAWDPSSEVTAYSRREPVGVVGQILPWNFPLAIAVMKAAPALAAGCTLVLKPAEQTPLNALLLAEIATAAGLPDGVLNIVNGPGETAGAALTAHPDVDKISFTGSTDVGRLILTAAGGNLKKVTLELGGKAPLVVLADADVERAASAIVTGAYGNQGQNCVCAARIFVHASILEAVTAAVIAKIQALQVGPGLEAGSALGPLVSAEQMERVLNYVAIGQSEGAVLAAGGQRIGETGYFVQPTLFTAARSDMRIMREEIFGPVTCIESFETDDIDAIAAMANDTPFGLVASVFTRDVSKAHKLAARIKAGTVAINAHGHPGINAPFGGYKQSGWGREFGKAAIESYLETKTVAIHA